MLLLLFLALSNPLRKDYLRRLQQDYGNLHAGMSLSEVQLLQMGEAQRRSFIIFSTFEYQFGNIGVRYWGVAGRVFFFESYRHDIPRQDEAPLLPTHYESEAVRLQRIRSQEI